VVSEELHFRRAAERLHMAQPPLSRSIRKLEDELGVPLFERTSRIVVPTDAGRIFAEAARTALASLDLAVADARRASRALRIGFTPHLPTEQLLRFIGALREQAPSTHTRVTHLPAIEQLRCLHCGELDLAILPWVEDDPNLEREPLFPGEPLAVFLPANHALTEREKLGPRELAKEALVNFPREINPALADWLRAVAHHAGYRFRDELQVEGNDPRDWIIAVAAGDGVALLPHRLKEVSDAGRFVIGRSLDPPLALPNTVVAWRTNPPCELQPMIAAIRELACELRRNSHSSAVSSRSGEARESNGFEPLRGRRR